MLPIKTSPEDVQAVVVYLRTKPTGVTINDAKATLEARLLDGRKISAYKYWGFIEEVDGRLKLLPLGRELAMANGNVGSVYQKVIRNSRAYRMAIEWIFHQSRNEVLSEDLAAHWHEHMSDELGTDTETSIRGQVSCFFQLSEAAGFGEYILGRGNASTRFNVNRDAVKSFVIAHTDEDDSEEIVEASDQVVESSRVIAPDSEKKKAEQDGFVSQSDTKSASQAVRVFISHGKNTAIVDQVKTMLDVTNLNYEVAVETETAAIPVPDKVITAMRRCTAAIICVTADADTQRGDGAFIINENVLIEIGAAFVLYDKKVVLVWDRRLTIPSNLQGLYRCEFEGNELSWSAGMKLMKAMRDFK